MSAPAITYQEFVALRPCIDRLAVAENNIGDHETWNGRKVTAAEARDAGMNLNDLVWVASKLSKTDNDIERRLRLWAADCAARVLHIFERECPNDDRPRAAIVAARLCARQQISKEQNQTARDAAWVAVWAAPVATARAAAGSAAGDARRAARADEEQWQFDRFVQWFSDKEPDDWPLPEKEASK